ncbi:MAG TPA: acyl-CoA mutase large subunit family protein, partial [Bryobacteraceae bacterium]|nr:acyl-CoA mutase large subunit family protein [Bryobacteraceae bacterium]
MPDRLLDEFPPVTTEQWIDAIRRDLKGADYEKKLIWRTEEGIDVKPFYRSEDIRELPNLDTLPGEFPYLRGTRLSNAWRIRERIFAGDVKSANERARKAVAAGAEEIAFDLRKIRVETASDLLSLVDSLDCPVHFEAGPAGLNVLRLLAEAAGTWHGLAGSLDYDPHMNGIEASDVDAMLELVRSVTSRAPTFRPLSVNAHRFRDSGGSIVQELGYALAAGIDYLGGLTSRGFSVDDAARSLGFSFAAGSNFFFEIAKLRAARMLWAQAVQSFGPSKTDSAKAAIHVRGSRWNKTIYDPYVNIVRSTTEALAAVLGGCDSLETPPFDECFRYPDDFSRRLARNTQIIMKKEAWLDRVADPAGGSYYVEALTDSLARAAWKLMQEVEKSGGFSENWKRGSIQAEIEKSRKAKEDAVAHRRTAIIGTNQHPDPHERMLDRIERKPEDAISPRAAEVFERLRLRTERHAARGGRVPFFLLAEFGDLKMRRARSQFAAGFFECAGFKTETASFANAEEAAA